MNYKNWDSSFCCSVSLLPEQWFQVPRKANLLSLTYGIGNCGSAGSATLLKLENQQTGGQFLHLQSRCFDSCSVSQIAEEITLN